MSLQIDKDGTHTFRLSTRTICGIDELGRHGAAGVTHVLSILDPGWPELPAFAAYGKHQRTTLNFHDIIDPQPGQVMPTRGNVQSVLDFGRALTGSGEGHLLVHCHMGISRSTAAMLMLMAEADPEADADELFGRLRTIRSQAWPNSVMVGFADDLLGQGGRLISGLRRHYAFQLEANPRIAQWMSDLGRGREVAMADAS